MTFFYRSAFAMLLIVCSSTVICMSDDEPFNEIGKQARINLVKEVTKTLCRHAGNPPTLKKMCDIYQKTLSPEEMLSALNPGGSTGPLFFAVVAVQDKAVAHLISLGACVDAQDSKGNIALHYLLAQAETGGPSLRENKREAVQNITKLLLDQKSLMDMFDDSDGVHEIILRAFDAKKKIPGIWGALCVYAKDQQDLGNSDVTALLEKAMQPDNEVPDVASTGKGKKKWKDKCAVM